MRKIVAFVKEVLQRGRMARNNKEKWDLVGKIVWQKTVKLAEQRDKEIGEIMTEFAGRGLTGGSGHLAKIWEPRKKFLEELFKAHLDAVRQVGLLAPKNLLEIKSMAGSFLRKRFQHEKGAYLRFVVRVYSGTAERNKREKWVDGSLARILEHASSEVEIATELAKVQAEPPLLKKLLPTSKTEILGYLFLALLIFLVNRLGVLSTRGIELLFIYIFCVVLAHILAVVRSHYSQSQRR